MDDVKVYWKNGAHLCIAKVGGVESHNEAIKFVRNQFPVEVPEDGDVKKFAVMALVK